MDKLAFRHWFWLLGLMVLLLTSCQKEEKYSDIPHIEFISLESINDGSSDMDVRLTFKFQDGNGDIGLDDDDTETPFDTASVYYYNCFISYFEKQNGEFVEVELPFTMNMRIPRLSKYDKESIEGEIYMDLYANNPFSKFDTIRYEVFIVDRALNHSNTITTSEYIVSK